VHANDLRAFQETRQNWPQKSPTQGRARLLDAWHPENHVKVVL